MSGLTTLKVYLLSIQSIYVLKGENVKESIRMRKTVLKIVIRGGE